MHQQRFECVREPTETWMIWDRYSQAPAELEQTALIGLQAEDAYELCDLMNEM